MLEPDRSSSGSEGARLGPDRRALRLGRAWGWPVLELPEPAGLVAARTPRGPVVLLVRAVGAAAMTVEVPAGLPLAPGDRIRTRPVGTERGWAVLRLHTVRASEGTRVASGSVLELPGSVDRALGRALFTEVGARPEDLCRAGFAVPRVADLLRAKEVTTHAEYRKVLDLRARTYRGAGRRRLPWGPTHFGRASEVDGDDRVRAYWHGDRLVASVAMSLPTGDRSDAIEISRLCADPAYRCSDALRRLFGDIHEALVRAGRRRILIEAPRWLVGAYRWLGFRPTGVTRALPEDPDLVLVEMQTVQHRFGTYGLHTDPIRWNLYLRDAAERLRDEGVLRLGRRQRFVLGLYALCRPVADRVDAWLLERRRPEGS